MASVTRSVEQQLRSSKLTEFTMERVKAKEKLKYVEKLDDAHCRRYVEKLSMINGFDPYESNERDWSTDPE